MRSSSPRTLSLSLSLLSCALLIAACSDDTTTAQTSAETSESEGESGMPGDGDGDPAGDGDGDGTGDGDGDSAGDGDGDGTGDGDGDDSGDGDGDGSGDGDGDTSGDGDGDTSGDGDGDDSGDGDGDGGPSCELEPEPIMLALSGSQAPPDSCDSYVFSGRFEQGGNGNYNLDACPCGVMCFAPDPYDMTISLPEANMLPIVPQCLTVEMIKNEDCEVMSLVIRDLQANEALAWAGVRAPFDPASLTELDVLPVGPVECNEHVQFALEFTLGDEVVLLGQGEGATSEAGWELRNYASLEPNQAPGEYAWVVKP